MEQDQVLSTAEWLVENQELLYGAIIVVSGLITALVTAALSIYQALTTTVTGVAKHDNDDVKEAIKKVEKTMRNPMAKKLLRLLAKKINNKVNGG